jgi:predicted phosphodiesterase
VQRRAVLLAAGRRHQAHRVEQLRHQRWRTVARWFALAAVILVGALLGMWLGGTTTQEIGPFQAQLTFTPSLRGDTSVEIPPLGSLDLDSHDGPIHLGIRLQNLDETRTRALASSGSSGTFDKVGQDAVDQLSHGVRRLALQTIGSGMLGAMLLSALVFRTRRETAIAGFASLALFAGGGLTTVLTFRPDAIQEPHYTGLLTNAPAVIGDARRIATRYEEYRDQLQQIIANVSKLYSTISALPVYEPDKTATKVLHISDMHLNPAAWTVVRTVADQFNVNMVVDTGDINDWGSQPEASYGDAISTLRVPYVYIRGNHDSATTAAAVAREPNATVLDGQIATVGGITFAGIGDPRFTPDKETDKGDAADTALVDASGEVLASFIRSAPKKVDVALVHDPASATALGGVVPLVLAGHLHERQIKRLEPAPTPSGAAESPDASPTKERTLLMVEGSTGGAGLRGLQKASGPLPLALSILYFDSDHVLQAYDDIRVGGTGLTEVSIERHLVAPDRKVGPSPSLPASPSLSPAVGARSPGGPITTTSPK